MDKELVINSSPTEVEIAFLEDTKLVELHRQKSNNNFMVGDIFLGRITKTVSGLNAAFVDIGHSKEAFLHYSDLGPKLNSLNKFTRQSIGGDLQDPSLINFKLEPDILKSGKVNTVLKRKDSILVQILKEPISTKGPRLTSEITIPGRYMVLTLFNSTVSVSKKISNQEERKRLHLLMESIKPANFGVIIRTAAEGKKVADLHDEMSLLVEKWNKIHSQLKNAQPPVKLLSELNKPISLLRDLVSDSFNKIVVNDPTLHDNIKAFMDHRVAEKADILKLYKGKKPIFETFGVNRQIKSSFGKTATMKSGAYIVIESTEAMHVIDVNSGPKMSKKDQAEAVFSVNLESAKEIARQLRLRDIGGLIVIDFIDMRDANHRKILYQKMVEYMKNDRAQHTILTLSKFGLMQITRQRTRPAIKINTSEHCPVCNGTGKVNASVLLIDNIERDIDFLFESRPSGKLSIKLHPFVHAYIKKGVPNIQMKWYMKYNKWIKVSPDPEFHLLEYHFYDGNLDEIRMK